MRTFAHYLRQVCPEITVIVQKAETALLKPALSEKSKFPLLKLEHASSLQNTNLTHLLDKAFPDPFIDLGGQQFTNPPGKLLGKVGFTY